MEETWASSATAVQVGIEFNDCDMVGNINTETAYEWFVTGFISGISVTGFGVTKSFSERLVEGVPFPNRGRGIIYRFRLRSL
jgi:hypothetical protein